MYLQVIAALAALTTTVSGHGYVDNVTVAGVFYEVRALTHIRCNTCVLTSLNVGIPSSSHHSISISCILIGT